MHAAGHALLALLAGGLAASLTFGGGAGNARLGLLGILDRLFDARQPLANRAFSYAVLGLLVVTVKSGCGVYATYVQGWISGEVGAALRLQLLDSLLAVHRLRRPRHGDQGVGVISQSVTSLTEHVHEVEIGLKEGLLGGLRAAGQLVPLAGALFFLSPRTALAAAAVFAVFGVLLGRVRAAYRRASARLGIERARLLEAADESVRHADLWVSYGAELKVRRRVADLGEAIARRAARLDARAAALSGANEVLGAAALVVAVGAARTPWFGPMADGGTLIAFAVTFFMGYRPMRELTEARLALARASAAQGELGKILDACPPSHTGSHAGDSGTDGALAPSRGGRRWSAARLELRALRLSRGACAPISMRVEPGSIVAVVGPTGIGKTTLLRTLLGLERAAAGDVVFGDASIADAPAGPASRPFAWVPQDAPLIADTLDANVSLGGGDSLAATALDPMGATHLVESLGTARLGAGGRAVSGGERQWIALARAVATEQPVLLLDEPTTGLDAEAERRVLEAIEQLRGARTVLLVTHRPEPLAVADVVVRLSATGAFEYAA
jgi:ABC-type multidrug transport system fused ATPase/permease subunit